MTYSLRSNGPSRNQEGNDNSQKIKRKKPEWKGKYVIPRLAGNINNQKEAIKKVVDLKLVDSSHAASDIDAARRIDARPDTSIRNILEQSSGTEGDRNAPEPDKLIGYCNSHNFEKAREPGQFLEGQIWAIYDDYGLPRQYVQILLISSGEDSIYVSLLEHNKSSEEQNVKEASWVHPVCGRFASSSMGINVTKYSFSHRVYPQMQTSSGGSEYLIYPRKGEVWAIYSNGSRNSSPRLQNYHLVEIINDFNMGGFKAVRLIKADSWHPGFCKRQTRDGTEVYVHIGPNELNLFSHQVPAFQQLNSENHLFDNCIEVDLASLPHEIEDSTNGLEPRISCEFLRLKVIDYKSTMLREKLRNSNIWAVYDDVNGLPRRYALIESVSSREVMTLLEPYAMSKDETKWHNAGLPLVCGNFRLKKTILSLDYSILSHPVQYDWHPVQSDQGSFSKQYTIYPRKCEVWAIYRDWELICGLLQGRGIYKSNFEYEFVEILTDFNENEGVEVVKLKNLAGISCLFKRLTNNFGRAASFIICGSQLCRFSHQILNCRIHESGEIDDSCLLLDPFVVFPYAKKSLCGLQDPDSMGFEADNRGNEKFLPGQLWALYDYPDRMPRSYAIVCSTFPEEHKVEVMLLHPHPLCEEEMEWMDKNLPISCGTFCADKVTTLKEVSDFSHQIMMINDNKKKKSFYRIIPQRGEVWAVYQNWEHLSMLYKQYQMVEIVSPFDQKFGLNVAPLFEVANSRSVFKRHLVKGFDLVKSIPVKEMLQFSHQVPASRISEQGDEMKRGHWKLKAAAIPLELSSS